MMKSDIVKDIGLIFVGAVLVSLFMTHCSGGRSVYVDYSQNKYHSSPVCDSIDDLDIDYMEETNKVVGTKKMDEEEVYMDKTLKMCDYCFSLFEIKQRNNRLYNNK